MNAKRSINKKCITQRKPEEKIRNFKMGTFDFETTALDGDVIYGSLQYEHAPHGDRSAVLSTYSAAGMLDLLFEHSSGRIRWYAHNLEFDLLYLLHEANRRLNFGEMDKIELMERGMGNFFKAVFHRDDKKIELYDSMALFGFSLKIFAAQFSTVGGKLELDFEKETFDITNVNHIAYANQDTRSLLDAMVNLDAAIYQIFSIHVKGTISSTALAAWETTLNKTEKYFKTTEAQAEFCRDAYFGGLVFVTSTEKHRDIVSVDVNSMYPHCMRTYGVPVGVPQKTKSLHETRPGIYKVKVKAPLNLDFGCIGYRDKKGIAWPRGEFETTCFDFEIRRALRWEYEIEIIDGLLFEQYAYPFETFINLCEEKRTEYKGQAFEIVVKLIQNSIYGKFGTKPEGKEILMSATELDETWLPYVNSHGGALPIDNCYERETERDTYYMLPHWAAAITARARGELLDIVELCEGNAIYGDTDSVKMPRETYNELILRGSLKVGKRYGELKLDDEYETFRAIAPKVYAYESKQKFSGRGKGIPEKNRTTAFWQSVFEGDKPTVEYNSLGSLNSALKQGGKRQLTKRTRTTTDLDNSRGWVDNAGRVKSIIIKDGERHK